MSSPANDPRMPSAARPYRAPLVSPQDLPVDYSGFLAVLCGVVGVMFKYKLGSWLALIFCAQSLANMRNMENDLKQISMAMMLWGFHISVFSPKVSVSFHIYYGRFSIMGLVTNYFKPTPSKQS